VGWRGAGEIVWVGMARVAWNGVRWRGIGKNEIAWGGVGSGPVGCGGVGSGRVGASWARWDRVGWCGRRRWDGVRSVDDTAGAAYDYERECTRYSMEMFTSIHGGNTRCIFWVGPQVFILENSTGNVQPTGTPAIYSSPFMVHCA